MDATRPHSAMAPTSATCRAHSRHGRSKRSWRSRNAPS